MIGQNYEQVANINGAGNSSQQNNYQITDIKVNAGVCYVYRLLVEYFDNSSQILDSVNLCYSPHNACLIASYLFNGEDDGEMVNGATPTSDRFRNQNQAYAFDGIDDYISTINSYDFSPNQDFAIMFWLKIPPDQTNTDTTENVIMSRCSNDTIGNYGYSFHISVNNQSSGSPGKLNISRWGKNCNQRVSLSSVSQINDDLFHLILFQKVGNMLKLFIDYRQDAIAPDSINCTQSNNSSLILGKVEGANPAFFTGILDDIRFFSCPLDSSDILYFTPVEEISEITTTGIQVYPNPVSNVLYVANDENLQIDQTHIYNMVGERVCVFGRGEPLDFSTMPNGIYFISFFDMKSQMITVRKVMKG